MRVGIWKISFCANKELLFSHNTCSMNFIYMFFEKLKSSSKKI